MHDASDYRPPPPAMARPPLTRSSKLFYGLGSAAFGVKDNGFAFFLLLYYNQVLGLPEAWVGLGIMLALVLDGVFDPIVGYASDHLHSRWGRRHPFMYAAAIPVAVSYYFLWSPPSGLSPQALFAYFFGMAVLVRTFITFYEIPSASLVAELTDDYDERTSVLGYRYFFGWWGGLTIAVLAYAFFLQPDASHPVGVLNPAGYRTYGLASAVIMATTIVVSAAGTHRYIPWLKQPPPHGFAGLRRSFAELGQTLAHRSLLFVLGAAVFGAMAQGLMAALNIYFNTYFWELTSSQIALIATGNFLSAAIALGLAPRLSRAVGKKTAAIGAWVAGLTVAPAPIVLRLAGAFPRNGSTTLVATLFVFNVFVVTLLITASILVSSMVADVAEDSELQTGRRSEGTFFAAMSFVQKCVSGIGVFASGLLLRAIDFPSGAKPGEVGADVVRALGVVFVPTVVALFLVGVAFLAGYRIDRERHQENLRRLARRAAV